MRPLLLKMGVAVSFSVAGYLCSHLIISRPDRRRLRDQHPRAAPGVEGGREPCAGLKDEILLLQREEARSNVVINGATGIKVAAAMADAHLSSQSKISRDEEVERVLSEFNALVLQEFEQAGLDMAALEPPPLKRSTSDYKNRPEAVAESVVVLLKSLVRSLHERERSPVIPLLVYYYGLREQEYSAAVEVESRLKVSAVEAGFLISLKIETLQAENRRLAADHRETKAELESARAKVRRLGRKLKSESLRAKQRVAVLQRRVVALQDMERRRAEAAEEAERRLTKVKDLEGEVAELRRANSNLAVENSDMAKKLESMESLASSGLPSSEATKTATEESNSLRQKNEELIEQLQTDHCTDVEKLVYLRWVNACLCYKFQNYQSLPGKTVAMDLSRTLIPESEHRVKQLILEYANSGVIAEKSINMADFDSESCSSSQASSEEPYHDVAVEVSNTFPMKRGASSGKKKFFNKLKRLVLSMENKGQSKFNSPVRWMVTPP